MSSPEEIEQQIEQTRASLSADVDRLGQKVSPAQTVNRRMSHMKTAADSLRERVMGSLDGGAKDSLASATSTVSDTATQAPETVRRQAQGNPFAAGLIAFGVGWLAGSLIPASSVEQRASQKAEQKARDFAEPVKEKAQEMAGNLQEPLKESAEQVRSTAQHAATETADQAKSAAAEGTQRLRQ